MDKHPEHIAHLWSRYFAGTANAADLEALFAYNHEHADDEEGSALVEEILSTLPAEKTMDPDRRQAMLQSLLTEQNGNPSTAKVVRIKRLQAYLSAAAVLLLLAFGAYLWLRQQPKAGQKLAATTTEIQPGKNGAILTLADGSTLVLDSLGNGVIAQQQGAQVVLKDGELAYDPTKNTAGALAYNTMTTPAGRQFSLLLPDGSRVWLNAASAVRFPTTFSGAERLVEVTGEVYIEVAENPRQPFRVNLTGGAAIEVLGTEFNINGYQNEKQITTTLVQGQIRIRHGNDSTLLRPGQQAKLAATTAGINVVNKVNMEMVTAWKNGVFNFEGMSLEEAMRQVERWYDIKVEYPQGVPNVHFGGEMDRNVSLSQLLTILKNYGVNVQMQEDRKMIILK